MKLHLPLLGLMLAFPCLYLSGAVLQHDLGSLVGLLSVAGVCLYLLWPRSNK